ncbi:preprotein translocase subunit SecE [Mycobacterium sp. E2462]|uniref:preprotein translocase subunit SecE n=1 Tax=unclassified Mycobacterium TaxID=2642494 RepID=UPI0007FF8C45|nr:MULTISPECIES: preprotein translocase subunit SecE [unclassified Mycobacterium]OBG75083.1 preprotein translocase subunit SecE [Mycobacterium sp. E1214]OBH23484.1 preprotein translocase subunit SecE [Mycobacterium sp. E1319]OBI16200.1 preprotein translocase subunit SecE [Mycobacterium sp. E2462]
MSDEGDAANDAASDGGGTEDTRDSGGRTAVVTKPVARPQRPTGKRTRQRVADAEEDVDAASSAEAEASAPDKGKKDAKAKKAKKPKKPGDRTANPFLFVFNYLKQVVAEMRKVIWPNRKQMVSYTTVVLVFLAFMVALVGLADFGLTKLVLLVFG